MTTTAPTFTKTSYGVTTSENCTNGVEMLKAAGADFEIEKRQLSYAKQVGMQTGVANGEIVELPRYEQVKIDAYAAVRSDNGEHVSNKSIGDGYTVLQNREMIDIVDTICAGHNLNYSYMTQMRGGAGLAIQVSCPDLASALNVGDDRNEGRLTLTNFHDGTGQLKVHVSLIRMMCNNTLPAIGREFRNKRQQNRLAAHCVKHSSRMEDRVADMIRCYKECMGEMVTTAEILQALANKRCTKAGRIKFFTALFTKPDQEGELTGRAKTIQENNIADLQVNFERAENKVASAKGTWYEALQAATWQGTHGVSVRPRKNSGISEAEARFASQNFKDGAMFNVRALELATQFAGV